MVLSPESSLIHPELGVLALKQLLFQIIRDLDLLRGCFKMAHIDLGLRCIVHNLRVVHIRLLDQYLTNENLHTLVPEKVLQQLLLVLRLQRVDWYLIQILHLDLVRSNPCAFHILEHCQSLSFSEFLFESIQVFHEEAE